MNIYVGNLAYSVTETDIADAFSGYGKVSNINVIKDMHTGQSKGFAFVEMTNNSEADAAIKGLNGQAIQGRNIKVNQAQPKTDRDRSRGGRRSY